MVEMTAAATIALICGLLLSSFQQTLESPKPARATHATSSTCLGTESAERRIERAKAMLAAGSRDQAISMLREVLHDEPDNSDAHLLLGTALALVPQRGAAIQEFQRAVELRPNFALGYYSFGTALAQFGDLNTAKPMFEKAIELDQNFADAHVSLALILAQSKQLAEARPHLERAINLKGSSAAAAYPHYLLGKVLSEQGEFSQALEQFETATKVNGNYAEAYLAKGLIQKKLLRDTEGLQSFQKAAELAPLNAEVQYQLGTAYLHENDVSDAIEHLQNASTLKPGDRSSLYQLCRALRKANRSTELKQCERKLAAEIKSQQAADANMFAATQSNNDGVQLEKKGDIATALEKYRIAVALDPYTPAFRRNLALAFCRLGKWEEAIPQLREVLDLNPEDTEATKALYVALDAAKTSKKK